MKNDLVFINVTSREMLMNICKDYNCKQWNSGTSIEDYDELVFPCIVHIKEDNKLTWSYMDERNLKLYWDTIIDYEKEKLKKLKEILRNE